MMGRMVAKGAAGVLHARIHTDRGRSFDQRCKTEKSRSTCYKVIRGPPPARPQLNDRPDGSKTGNLEERLHLLKEAWWGVYNGYPEAARPEGIAKALRSQVCCLETHLELRTHINSPHKVLGSSSENDTASYVH